MKRTFSIWLMGTLITMAMVAGAAAQNQSESLGAYARAIKKSKGTPTENPSSKVYDNDTLPSQSSVSVVGSSLPDTNADSKSSDAKTPAGDQDKSAKSDDKKKDPELKTGQSSDERQKAVGEWKSQIDAQKAKVDLAARELDVLQREYKLKSATFYTDTARRVQNPNGFAADDAKYKQQIAERQKKLDDERSKLSDMQNRARQAGAPNSVTE